MLIVDIKKPKKCIWYEDGQDCKCPLLDDNDCCRAQGNEANSAANDWDDLIKGCPIKGVLPETHGRLIDASTVIGIQKDEEDNDLPVTVDDYLGLQFPVPTIVPATERSET